MRIAASFLLRLVCAGGIASCTGFIEEPYSTDEPGPGAGPDSNDPRMSPAPPSPDTGLRRLTRTEYANTLHDLLGDTARAGSALDPDVAFNGLDNNADMLKLSAVALDKYDAIANDVVEKALRAGSASRTRLVKCDLAGLPCARSTIAAFARRAWRRPVANDELDGLMTALDEARAQGDNVEEGVKLAFRIVLVSPNLLYRAEIDPSGAKGLHPVGPHELATRLSYFVWASTLDDRLLDLADEGTLSQPDIFTAQLGRMLDDTRAEALINNFAAQWLNTRAIETVAPDPKVFQTFDDDLRRAMIGESQAFFRAFLKSDRNVADMLDADFTIVNERLAKHYLLPNVTGTSLRQVPAGGATNRFGLLTQAGVLTLTSNPNRTSPVKRGKWVLARLLCSPPPPPPPSMPPLPSDPKAAGLPANATLRQMMAAHRNKPECAACHAVMDPVGFGLEHYNAIGAWRDAYPKNTIDASGELPGGLTFDGAEQLTKILKADPRFIGCFARTLFAYALGRDPKADGDQAAIDVLASAVAGRGGRMRDLVVQIASSNAFQLRGGQP